MGGGKTIAWAAAIVALGLFLLGGGCRNKHHLEPHYWVKYSGTFPVTGKKDTLALFVETVQTADSVMIIYQSEAFALKYTLNKDTKKEARLVSPFHQNKHLKWERDTAIAVGGEIHHLVLFHSGDGAIDGGVKHYWCPEIGIIALHAETWPTLWLLQTNNLPQNQLIRDLAKAVFPPGKKALLEY